MSGLSKIWRWPALGAVLCLCFIAYYIWTRQNYLAEQQQEFEGLKFKLNHTIKENDDLAHQLQTYHNTIHEEETHRELEKLMSEERGLTFGKPVAYERMNRRELKEYLISKIGSQYTPEEFRSYENALKRIGLLSPNLDFMKSITDLLSEQVAAFYDPDVHKLYTFSETDLRNNLNRTILAHELIHALQDQNFQFHQLALRTKNNDDAALASSALVEGDATYQMSAYLRKNYRANEILKDLRVIGSQNMDQLRSAPAYLRDSLVFPYQDGQVFVASLHALGGNAAIDAAFRDPPRSSEQILHPEKYWGPHKDPPKDVKIDLKVDSVWNKVHENVMGEMGVKSFFSAFFDSQQCLKVSEGWGGDCYEVYEKSPEQWFLVWKTEWDSAKDAREFFDALEGFYLKKYNLEGKGSPPRSQADTVFFSESPQKQNITIRDATVFFVSTPDLLLLQMILEQLNKEK